MLCTIGNDTGDRFQPVRHRRIISEFFTLIEPLFYFAGFLGWTKLTHQPHPDPRQWHHELPRHVLSLHQNHGIRQTAFLGRNWGISISNSRILRHDRLPKHNPQHHSRVSQGQEFHMNTNMSRITLFYAE